MKEISEVLGKETIDSCRICNPRWTAGYRGHTEASLLIASGVTPQQTQEFLGYETVSTTMNIYAHCLNEAKIETANLMNEIYFS